MDLGHHNISIALKILMNEEEGLKVMLKKAVLNAINRAHELKN